MSEIQPQEKLQLLRELLLADERRDLAALRDKLVALEREIEEASGRSIAELLREPKQANPAAYEAYVAALQDGTESAIERSVSSNKARLAGALFPIMGPAIRSYVAEMFRSLAEDLNSSLQNATSIERLRWRFQARMSGVPFSEYVALKTANFRVEELYLMEKGSGLLIQRLTADPDHESHSDPDLMSGMLTAIRSFTRDVFGEDLDGDGETDEDQELDRFTFGGRQVLIEDSPSMVLAAVVRGTATSVVRERMRGVLETLHERFAHSGSSDAGGSAPDVIRAVQTAEPDARAEVLDDALIEAHSTAAREVGAGGGLWRAWVFLAVVVLGLGAWIGWKVWDSRRWAAFADRLRAEPGIEVISADGPRIVGLRDPLAGDPAELAPDPERAELVFTPFHSLHPGFVEQRAAAGAAELIALQQQATAAAGQVAELDRRMTESMQATTRLEGELAKLDEAREQLADQLAASEALRRRQIEDLLSSRFAHVEGLEWSFSAAGLAVTGGAPEPYYTQIVEQLGAINSLGSVDASGLVNLSGVTLEGLLKEFATTRVIFDSGTTNQLAVEATVKRLVEMIGQLDEIAAESETRYDYRIRSHPLIGDNRAANKVIEQQRAEDLRRRLVEAGIDEERLTFELSDDIQQAGRGVEIVPDLQER